MDASSTEGRGPYVGSNPFSRTAEDRDRFFGREGEISDLVSLIFGHPFVLLYAESGAGKTSLCNAGVIPQLETPGQDFQVLPVTRVRPTIGKGLDPERARNSYMFNLLSGLAPMAEPKTLMDLTLSEYLTKITRPRANFDRPAPRALFIDQGEELFTYLPDEWEARQRDFFSQIEAALRLDPLLRVVYAIREDFLGRMMPFAPLLTEELRVRMRLTALSRERALEAIERPLEKIETSFAPGVTGRLVDELAKINIDDGTGTVKKVPGASVEPVHLQIVCEGLWRSLAPGQHLITEDDVRRFGDVDQALGRLYESSLSECLAKTYVPEAALRTWFAEKLITPAGTRGMVFREKETTGGISNKAVDVLEERHVVRAEARAGGRWYELSHDRLVGPIREANRAWEERRALRAFLRRHKRFVRRAAVPIGLVLAAPIWMSHHRSVQRESEIVERARTTDRLDDLRQMPDGVRDDRAGPVFDSMATYLWVKRDIDSLMRDAKQYEDLIPPSYAIESVPEEVEAPPLFGAWLSFTVSADLDPKRFAAAWRTETEQVLKLQGIPLPQLVGFRRDSTLPVGDGEILSADPTCSHGAKGGSKTNRFQVHLSSHYALISEARLPEGELRTFFKAHQADWKRVDWLTDGGPFWLVPRWFLPMVKAAGGHVFSREASFAMEAANELLKHPEIALSCGAVSTIASAVARDQPKVVEEVLSARGSWECVRQDLLEAIRLQVPLVHPGYVFEALAEQPGDVPPDRAARAVRDQAGAAIPAAGSLHGPWRAGEVARLQQEFEAKDLARDFGNELELLTAQIEHSGPVRVSLDKVILPAVVTEGDALRDTTMDRLAGLRLQFHRRFGISVPGVRFNDQEVSGSSGNGRFRLELLNETATAEDAQPIAGDTDRLYEEIAKRFARAAPRWINADSVYARLAATFSGKEREWLSHSYSLTDLVNILRRVVAKEAEQGSLSGPVSAVLDVQGAVRQGNTIRDLPWLLGSIAFWRAAGRDTSVDTLAGALRETQQAHLGGQVTARGSRSSEVDEGIAAIAAEDYPLAERAFRRAVSKDKERARQQFLGEYGAALGKQVNEQAARLRTQCELPVINASFGRQFERGHPSIETLYEIDDVLDAGTTPPDVRAALELCRIWSSAGDAYPTSTVGRFEQLCTRSSSWSPAQSFFLAYSVLWVRRNATTAPPELRRASELLAQAFQGLSDSEGESAVWQLVTIDGNRLPPHWLRRMMGEAVLGHATTPGALIAFASWMSARDEEETPLALRALERLNGLPFATGALSPERSRLLKWVHASALVNLARYKSGDERASLMGKATSILEGLKKADPVPGVYGPTLEQIYGTLADAYTDAGRFDDVPPLLDEGLHQFPESGALVSRAFFSSLSLGDIKSARDLARTLVGLKQRGGGAPPPEYFFPGALIEILAHGLDYERTARGFVFGIEHEYRDYIRLMLAWRLRHDGRADDADDLLAERWRTIDPKGWPERLQSGDPMVWREMLVGYAAGHVSRDRFLDPLENPTALERSEFRNLGLTLRELRCEFFFYDALVQEFAAPPGQGHALYLESLRQATRESVSSYYELHMARYLLLQAGERPPGPEQSGARIVSDPQGATAHPTPAVLRTPKP